MKNLFLIFLKLKIEESSSDYIFIPCTSLDLKSYNDLKSNMRKL